MITAKVAARKARRPDIFIFKYTQEVAFGNVTLPRSSRTIVRFSDFGLGLAPVARLGCAQPACPART